MQRKPEQIHDEANQQIPAVSILIPTLNEAGNIALLLTRTLAIIENNGLAAEVLVVDGGSTDGTQAAVQQWATTESVRFIQCNAKHGLAGDIITAAESARGEFVVVLDADLSHPPEIIPQIIRPLLDGTHDMALASRYAPGGAMLDWPWTRWLVSRVATLLVTPLVSVKDPLSGFFAVRREILLKLARGMRGFKIALEILVRADDSLRVTEVPIVFRNRLAGRSKFGPRQVGIFLLQLIALCGGTLPFGSNPHLAVSGLLALLLDLLVFSILLAARASPVLCQIASFFAATIFYFGVAGRTTFTEFARASGVSNWRLYGRFALIWLLVILLRSAIFTAAVENWQWTAQAAIVSAALISAALLFVGAALFVLIGPSAGGVQRSRWRMVATAVVGYILLLKLAFMGLVNVIPEEAYYWNYAQHLDIGYLDHPPMVAWLIWLSTFLFGNSEFAVRLPAVLSWVIASVFMFRLTVNLCDRAAAFRSVLLLAVLPIYFGVGFFITPDAPLYAAWAACLYFLERALVGDDRRAWCGVGLCIGLGMLAKYTIALLGLGALAFMLIDPRSRRWLGRPQPFFAVLLGAILFSPVLFWNMQNGWASFEFQGPSRWSGASEFSLHLLFASLLLVLTPVGLLATGKMFLPDRIAGIIGLRDHGGQPRRYLWLVCFTGIPLSVFVIHSLFNDSKLHWTGPILLAAVPLVAADMVARIGEASATLTRLMRRAWLPTIVVLLLTYAGMFYYFSIGLPGAPMSAKRAFGAWRLLADRVGQIESAVENETGREPIIVGMDKYMISSETSFYDLTDHDGARNTAGPHLFGGRSLMWEFWLPRSKALGRNLIMIDFDRQRLANPSLGRYFDRMSEVTEETLEKDGRVVGSFHWRIGYGYRSVTGKLRRLSGHEPSVTKQNDAIDSFSLVVGPDAAASPALK